MRAEINKLTYLKDLAPLNAKFLSDFEDAKKHATAIQHLTGIPASTNERLNLFKSISGSDPLEPALEFSRTKLDNLIAGAFDPKTPAFQRPSSQSAQEYSHELINIASSNTSIYRKAIQNLKKLHFQEPFYRKVQSVRSTQ